MQYITVHTFMLATCSAIHSCYTYAWQDHFELMQQCRLAQLIALQKGETAGFKDCQKHVKEWQELIDNIIDKETARILQVRSLQVCMAVCVQNLQAEAFFLTEVGTRFSPGVNKKNTVWTIKGSSGQLI